MANGSIEIPGLDFGELARHAIAQKITEAMVGADDAIRAICAGALAVKVDSEGKVGGYRADIPYVEYLTGQLIRKAAHEALTKRIEELVPAIEREVEKALRASVKETAQALTRSFVDRAKDKHAVNCDVKFTIRDPRA